MMHVIVIVFCVILYILNLSNAKYHNQHKKSQTDSYYDISDKAILIAEYDEMLKNVTTYRKFFNKSHSSPKLQRLSLAQDREDLWLWENYFFGVKVSLRDDEYFVI